MRLHRKYGYGLRNLGGAFTGTRGASPSADLDPSSFGVAADRYWNVKGVTIDTKDWRSFPLGLVAGLQYNM